MGWISFGSVLAGGVGIVIAQAAGRDVYSGGALIRFYGRLTVAGGLAAIVGPLLGGQLNTVTDWRALFVFLAVVGAALLVTAAIGFPETLPAERRTTGGFAQTARDFRVLLADRVFLGAVLNQGFMYAALFAYLSGATFVLQGIYGLSPQGYALAFGLNSAGFMFFGYVAGRGYVGYVGVTHGVQLDGLKLFFTGVHLHGGPAPVRRFLPELIQLIWDRAIDPGKVFDLTLPLDEAAEGYKAMDERRATKVLLTL